jgi:hypothetical protein
MIIAPGLPPVQETRHSRELSRKIDQVVRDYQRDHPDASLTDVRIALMQMTPGGDSPDVVRRRRVLGVVMGALVAGAFGAMATTGGGRFEGNTTTWQIIGVAAAAIGVAIAAIRIIRRA